MCAGADFAVQCKAVCISKLLAQIASLGKVLLFNNVGWQHCTFSWELSASVLIDIEAGLFAADHKPDQEGGTRCERSHCQARRSGGAESALSSCISAAAAARHQESGRAQCWKRPRQFSCKLPMLPECWALALVHAVLFVNVSLHFSLASLHAKASQSPYCLLHDWYVHTRTHCSAGCTLREPLLAL